MTQFVDIEDVSSSKTLKTVNVYWSIPKAGSTDKTDVVSKLAAITAYKNKSTRVFIRKGIHDKTYKSTGRRRGSSPQELVDDPQGDHFTAEYHDTKQQKWFSFHYYVELRDGAWVHNENVNPNPEQYKEGVAGKSTTRNPIKPGAARDDVTLDWDKETKTYKGRIRRTTVSF